MKRILYLICFLLILVGCRNISPSASMEAKTPDELKHLPVGTVIDLGDGYRITVLSEDSIRKERPAQQAIIRKCKNCGNTYIKDKSDNSDHSKTKDNSDNTQKNKQDQSAGKDSKTDNRVQQPPEPGTQAGGFLSGISNVIKAVVLGLLAISVLLLLRKLL
jgi:hypothetical protein